MLWYDEKNDSFHDYITNLYGGQFPDIKYKYDLDVIYKRSDVSFRLENTYKQIGDSFLDLHLRKHMQALHPNAFISPHKDEEWVEVTRSSTSCLLNWYMDPKGIETEEKKRLEDAYVEGYGKGWLDTFADIKNRKDRPYGCWFHMLRGTGIFVNVGTTLVAMNRVNAFQLLNIPFDHQDHDLCPALLARGYDSIQIFNSQVTKFAELVICSKNCSTNPVSSSCPPLELKTGYNADKPCNCNSSYPILNCNNRLTDALDCHNIVSEMPKIKQTCFYEDFTWINEFKPLYNRTNIAIFFSWYRHENLETLSKVATIINNYRNNSMRTVLVDSGHFSHSNSSFLEVLQAMDNLNYDIVPIRKRVAHHMTDIREKFKFNMLSLTSPSFLRSHIILRDNIAIGFISYSLQDLDIINIDTLVQLILDETLCLKRWADLVVLLSADDLYVDSYVSQRVDQFVDMILGGNSQVNNSCSGTYHTTNRNIVIHSTHSSSYLTVISIEIVSKNSYNFKSEIIDIDN